MPETEFYAEREDEGRLARLFFELGFYLVPDLTYETSDVAALGNVDSYDRVRLETTLFFALHNEFVHSPLKTFQIGGSGWNAGKYAIHQRQGGPSLSFLCFRPYQKNAIKWLPSGSVGYYATYKNTLTNEYEKIPSGLRGKYHQIRAYILNEGHLIEFENLDSKCRRFWIMPHAFHALKAGSRLSMSLVGIKQVRGLDDFPDALEES
jgi:hypothetical protein